jgi:hypothetical protein
MVAEAAPVSAVPDATAASKILSDIAVESRRAPLAESAAASLEVLEHRSSNETVGVSEDVIHLVSGALRTTDAVPLPNIVTTPRARPTFHAILPAILVAVVALSAYYVYRYPVQPGDWLSRSPPKLDVPAAADAGRTSVPPGPTVDSRTEVVTSSTSGGSIRGSRVDGVGGETPTPSEPSPNGSTGQPPRSTSQITAAQPSGNETARAARVSAAATTIAVEPRKKTARTVEDRGASQTVATPSTRSYPATAAVEAVLPRQADSRVNVPPETQRSSACTEAVAALGLCNPGTTGESK